MSVHFTLAKKFLSHAKDFLRLVFNENGADFKREEEKFLAAVKDAAHTELEKIGEEVQSGLQSWQMAPAAGSATSIGGGVDLPDSDTEDEDGPQDQDSATAPSQSSSSDSGSPASSDAAPSDAADDTETTTPPATLVNNPPAGDVLAHGDPDATPPTSDTSVGTLPPPVAVGPESGAADFHGDALPSSGIQSVAAAQTPASDAQAQATPEPATPALPNAPDYSNSSASAAPAAPYLPPTGVEPSQPVLGGTDPAVAEEAAAAQADVPQQKGDLDAQQGQGTPAADAESESTASSSAAS